MIQSLEVWVLHHKEETSATIIWNWRTSALMVKGQTRWHHLTVYLLTAFCFEVFSNMLFKSWFIYSQHFFSQRFFLSEDSFFEQRGKSSRWGKTRPEGSSFWHPRCRNMSELCRRQLETDASCIRSDLEIWEESSDQQLMSTHILDYTCKKGYTRWPNRLLCAQSPFLESRTFPVWGWSTRVRVCSAAN